MGGYGGREDMGGGDDTGGSHEKRGRGDTGGSHEKRGGDDTGKNRRRAAPEHGIGRRVSEKLAT